MKPDHVMGTDNTPARTGLPSACPSTDMHRWISRGGPLPARLTDHARSCPVCAERIRQINRVHAGLTLLGAQAVPVRTTSAANLRAMRMLRVAVRRSAAAARLLRSRPRLSWAQRAQLHMTRMTLASAAAGLMVVLRFGAIAGWERVEADGQRLAAAHWERHVDPTGEWMGPPPVV